MVVDRNRVNSPVNWPKEVVLTDEFPCDISQKGLPLTNFHKCLWFRQNHWYEGLLGGCARTWSDSGSWSGKGNARRHRDGFSQPACECGREGGREVATIHVDQQIAQDDWARAGGAYPEIGVDKRYPLLNRHGSFLAEPITLDRFCHRCCAIKGILWVRRKTDWGVKK